MMAARFQPKNNNKKGCFLLLLLLYQDQERPTLSSPIKALHDGRRDVLKKDKNLRGTGRYFGVLKKEEKVEASIKDGRHQSIYGPALSLSISTSRSASRRRRRRRKQNLCKREKENTTVVKKKKGERHRERVRHPFYQADITPYIKARGKVIQSWE